MIDVALLGTSGMMPLPNRYLTSFLCRSNGRFLLIDCGEGTQVTMKLLGWGFKNLDCICFTHFHADHISGLPGLLLTLGNSGRTEPVTIVGPVGIQQVVKSLCVIAPELPFPMQFIELELPQEKLQVAGFEIEALAVDHRVTCYGYQLNVPRRGKFDLEKAKALDLPKKYWSALQNNEEVHYNGQVFTSDMVLGADRKGIKVCYVTDTRPVHRLESFVEGSDLFVCEGIYGENEKINKAREYKHMLFSEAATIAKKANVKELWLTHFSPSLTNPEDFLSVATDIFCNTKVGYDRMTTTISFES